MWNIIRVLLVVVLWDVLSADDQFLQCHDDPTAAPDEGPLEQVQFTWLGALQYIHIKNGTPHYFRVPRVVLITRQFVLSTAKDAAEIPDGYALGNIAFGEYERDDTECALTVEAVADGADCDTAAILMPISDVLMHPEYNQSGINDSVALMKLLTELNSRYMVPVCLPFSNYIKTTDRDIVINQFYLVDFSNDVPRDMVDEDKELTRVFLLPKERCYKKDDAQNTKELDMDKYICTTGCGFHIGAASIVHERTGHWTIMALSLGGSPCPDPLRSSAPPPPPPHILIHPYVPWIYKTITGNALGSFDMNDPFGFVPRASAKEDHFGHDWNGHWWMGGVACFSRGAGARHMFKFYHEVFQVRPLMKTSLTYYLELFSAYNSPITCVKIGLPYQLARPKIWGLDTPEAKIRVPVLSMRSLYKFQIEAYAYNSTHIVGHSEPITSSSSSEEKPKKTG